MRAPIDIEKHLAGLKASDEDRINVQGLIDKYPEAADACRHLFHLIPDHDRLQYEVMGAKKVGGRFVLYDHHFLLNGLLIRSKKLCQALLREIRSEDLPGSASLLRAQCETLACAVYVQRNPDKLRKILMSQGDDKVNILTQLDHADREHKGLRGDYDTLSELVHPNSASHFSSIVPGKKEGKVLKILMTPEGNFPRRDGVAMTQLTVAWTNWTLRSIRLSNAYWSKVIQAQSSRKPRTTEASRKRPSRASPGTSTTGQGPDSSTKT